MKKKVLNILNVALDIFMVLFLIFSAFTLVVSLSQKTEEPGGKVSRIFGYTIRSVQSESMEAYDENGKKADGAFFKGDIIFCKVTDEDTTYEVGDTVVFWMPLRKDGTQCNWGGNDSIALVTHKIVRTELNEEGTTLYYTQGINKTTNNSEDMLPKTADEFVAKYNGKRIGGLGKVIDFVQSGLGFFLCIILPILIFVVIQTIRVIRNVIAYKAQKASVAAASGELSEEQKRLIAEEYLKQLNATDSNATPSTDEAPADEANSVEEETPAE